MTMVIDMDLYEFLEWDNSEEDVLVAMRALGAIGATPYVQIPMKGRILRADEHGELTWLEEEEAAPVFEDIEKVGNYVSMPNMIAGDYFEFVPRLGIPWPLSGAKAKLWKDACPRYRLNLPDTVLHDLDFGACLYLMNACKGVSGWGGEDDEMAQEIGQAAAQLFRTAQRHKLITVFK